MSGCVLHAELRSAADRRLALLAARPLTAALGRQVGVGHDHDDSSGHCRSRWWIAYLGPTVVRLAAIRSATAVVLLLLSAFLGTAAAQPREKVPRVGSLHVGSHSDPILQRYLDAFRKACAS